MRLQKYLASCGVASRRAAEKLIAEGHVTVDGQKITEMGVQVEDDQVICVDGKRVRPEVEKHYIMYHKPAGEVTTVSDPEGRATVLDRFRDYPVRLYPVGRLDYDSEGLLLLTNDGALAHRLLSPKSHVDKVYYARVEGVPDAADAAAFAEGLLLGDGLQCLPAKLEPLGGGECLVTLREGKFHQVKRMLASRGKPVQYLKRLAMGPLRLEPELAAGQCRLLTEEELFTLRNVCGL